MQFCAILRGRTLLALVPFLKPIALKERTVLQEPKKRGRVYNFHRNGNRVAENHLHLMHLGDCDGGPPRSRGSVRCAGYGHIDASIDRVGFWKCVENLRGRSASLDGQGASDTRTSFAIYRGPHDPWFADGALRRAARIGTASRVLAMCRL